MGLYFNITACLLALMLIAYNLRFNKSAVYLGISLFTLNLNVILGHFVLEYHSIFWKAIFFNNFIPFSFLTGPFIYFFVRGTLSGQDRIRLRDGWLFLPFLISLLGIIPYWLSPFSHKLQLAVSISQNPLVITQLSVNWLYPSSWNMFARALLFFICNALCLYTIWKYSPSASSSLRIGQAKFIRTFRWVLFLTIIFSILTVSFYTGLNFFINAPNPAEMLEKVKHIWLISDIGFLLITITVLIFPRFLYGRAVNFSKKGRQLSITDIENFHQVFYDQNYFLKSTANLEGLALALNFDKTDITSFILHQEELSFADFLQKSRIDYLAEILTIKDNQAFTIDAMSEMAGFGSRQAMYLAFKKFKNCSPTEYIYYLNK